MFTSYATETSDELRTLLGFVSDNFKRRTKRFIVVC